MRPVSLPSIEISDASVAIKDGAASSVSLPRRIDDVDVKAQFEYAPVHYSLTLDHMSFRGSSPNVAVRQLTGKLAVRDDNLYMDDVTLETGETSVTINGVIEQYLATPIVKITTTGNVSLPEIGRLVPAAAGYNLHPAFDLKADGPAERLALDARPAFRSRERPRPADDGRAGAELFGSRRSRRRASEPRADPSGSGTAHESDGPREVEPGDEVVTRECASGGSNQRHVRVQRSARCRCRLRGAGRQGVRRDRRTAHFVGRPCGRVWWNGDGSWFHRDPGARARARLQPARLGPSCQPD